MQTMQKKGITAIEWAITASIFILFIGWFFIISSPAFFPARQQSSFSDLADAINKMSSEVKVIAVVITTYNISNIEPIILSKELRLEKENLSMAGKKTYVFGNYIFFLNEIGKNSQNIDYLLIADNKTFSKIYKPYDYGVDLYANAKLFQTKDLRIDFENSLPKIISKSGAISNNYEIFINDINVNSISSGDEFFSNDFMARYTLITPEFNHTTFVFGNTTSIYYLLQGKQNVFVKLKYSLNSPTYYYSDNANFGTLPSGGCEEFEADFIWINATSPSAFYFPSKVKMRLCANSSESTITYSSILNKELFYRVDYGLNLGESLDRKKLYDYSLGLTQRVKGLTIDDIYYLKNVSLEQLQKDFGHKTFKMSVEFNNLVFEKGFAPRDVNIYSKVYYYKIIDNPAKRNTAKITFWIW